VELARTIDELEAVDVRHLDVGQEQVKTLAVEPGNCFDAASGGVDVVAAARKRSRARVEHTGLVVHYQDTVTPQGAGHGRSPPLRLPRGAAPHAMGLGERQTHGERRAHADRALDSDRATVSLNDAVADREPQASAGYSGFGREEWLKYTIPVLWLDTHSRITDADLCPIVLAPLGHRHDTSV